MNEPIELNLEQQFSQASFESQCDRMSRDQAVDFLKKMHRLMLGREAMYKHLMRTEGIGSISFIPEDMQ